MKITREKNIGAVYAFHIALIKTWFIEKFAPFFRTLINFNKTMNITFEFAYESEEDEIKGARFEYIKKHITNFFKTLLKVTNGKDMPNQLQTFLHDFFNHGSSLNSRIMTKYELERIYLDEYGTLYNVTPEVKDFWRLYFLIGKGLLFLIMLSPDGFGTKISKTSRENVKLIGSIIYYAMMENLNLLLPNRQEYEDTEDEPYEPLSKLVFSK